MTERGRMALCGIPESSGPNCQPTRALPTWLTCDVAHEIFAKQVKQSATDQTGRLKSALPCQR